MAIISNLNSLSKPAVEGGYRRTYANSSNNYTSNGNSSSRNDCHQTRRAYRSYENNRHQQHHQDSYSDNDESESSESSYDSVDSIFSTDSSYSASSTFSSGSEGSTTNRQHNNRQAHSNGSFVHSYKKPSMPLRNLYIAMDCEMVATEQGRVCARVVLVDWKGRTLLDTHVKPEGKVTDYLTFVSGITKADLSDALDFRTVQVQVKQILSGKILVGHGLENDLASLQMDHPWWMIRDTAYYQPFMQIRHSSSGGSGESFYVPRKLKDLCEQRLKKEIQVAGVAHCPYEDAKAALDLYKSHRPRWETCVTSQIHHQRRMARRQMQQQAYYAMAAAAAAPIASIAY